MRFLQTGFLGLALIVGGLSNLGVVEIQDTKVPLAIDDLRRHPILIAGHWDVHSQIASLKQISDGYVSFAETRFDRTQLRGYIDATSRTKGIPNSTTTVRVESPYPGMPQEYEDVTLETNGILIMAVTSVATVIYPGRQYTWSYFAAPKTEIHSIQYIGKDRVLVMQNGTPAKALIFDTKNDKLLRAVVIPTTVKEPHDMFRHVRMTRAGTLLVPHLAENKVCEYDISGKLLWSVQAPSPWHAERLDNGDTLIAGDWHHYAREVNPTGKTVWEFSQKDLPSMPLGNIHTANRLSNGNTVLSFWFEPTRGALDWPGKPLVLELTPEKQIVWAVSSWQHPAMGDYLGPANAIQLLDQAVPNENVYVDRPSSVAASANGMTVVGQSVLHKHEGARFSKKGNVEMELIPAGEFTMGSDKIADEKPRRKVYLDAYLLGRTPVTVGQFKAYCADKGISFTQFFSPPWGWHDEQPMDNVSWQQARDFCKWAGGDLPTEAQWEKAARGVDAREFPWGNEFDRYCLWCTKGPGEDPRSTTPVGPYGFSTAPAGNFPSGSSPYGCLDMAGNVRQWCLDWYANSYAGQVGRNPSGPAKGERCVLRGGSWDHSGPDIYRCANRDSANPPTRGWTIGFRMAARP